MKRDKVMWVDDMDKALGEMDKMEAHFKGLLHRAFSVFIFNDKGEILLQQRALNKYHGAGLWTNACCSHPQWGEDVMDAAKERLLFEMGLKCDIQFLFSFIYRADVENKLIEHEYDYVFVGQTNINPQPNAEEVQDYNWVPVEMVLQDVVENPKKYTIWFKKILPTLLVKMEKISSDK